MNNYEVNRRLLNMISTRIIRSFVGNGVGCFRKGLDNNVRGLSMGTPGSDSVEKISPNYQSISDYYAGKSVFITGGTGFLGKVLIERLLYNCSEIDNIYVLIRGKQGISPDGRLQQMLNVPLFEKLKAVKPSAIKKIIAIEGDVTKHGLGINPNDEQKIINNVSVVFHSAATVKFMDSFRDMVSINFEGTKRIMDLSKKIKNLETFLYISTAFSNIDKIIVDEMIYPPKRKEEEVYSFIDNYGDNTKQLTKFLHGLPNTYTFSKALCENYVEDNHKPMKTIIVRPSMVTPVLKEPLPGWLDNWIVATAVFSDVARGLIKVIYSDRNVVCDIIPVDYVCNLIIAAAARGNNTDKVIVYHSCTSSTNPITWKQATDLYLEENMEHGVLKPRSLIVKSSSLAVNFLTFTLQTTPAFFADLWLRLKGQKPKYLEMQKRPLILRDMISAVTSTSHNIKSVKTQKLIESLSDEDRVRFPCDPRTVVWREYMPIFYRGVQKYMKPNKKVV